MQNKPEITPPNSQEANVRNILEWLAMAHGRSGSEDADQLHRQILLLREAPLPCDQRIKILDLLYGQAARIAHAEVRALRDVSLPISRKLRQRLRIVQDLLSTLTQDYFNTLAELFDPLGTGTPKSPHNSLRRAIYAIAWQVRIANLIAAPTPVGLWQQLHAAFGTARRLDLDELAGPHGSASIRRLYLNIILTAIAHPSSFSATELEFIAEYVAKSTPPVDLTDSAPMGNDGIFWIDPDKDFPGHALVRRIPGPETRALYLSCDAIAAQALLHHKELLAGTPAELLGLPAFADSHTGPGVLLRLNQLWGHPAKRRFPRRRQSYRASLCPGLDNLWQLIKSPAAHCDLSEWMVTNESPDGYALMHMAGHTAHLKVGDIVALQAIDDDPEAYSPWSICIIRWAISENPEHIELGLQMLAPRAMAVEVANPSAQQLRKVAALMLPAMPPMRQIQSLVVPTGLISEATNRVIVMFENTNLSIRELHPVQRNEQSSTIEIFSVTPDDSP
jgi:cyclic-di-GMP-binding protein